MMPNVKGEKHTKLEILIYSIVLVAVTLVPWFTHLGGPIYIAVAVASGAWFLVLAGRLFATTESLPMRKAGRQLFTFSLGYLFVIFLAFVADHALHLAGIL